jgi:sterol desaturase/sphingolipid hydroxylase (fatty acid hydroxylase superfamily)
MTYDWLAALVFFAYLVALTRATVFLVFKLEPAQQRREENRAADKQKMAKKRFREAVKVNNKAGLAVNVAFYLLVLPWCISLDARPLWQHALEIVAVLLVFDFFYYWTHRSLFHGKLLRKVHSLHHQARTPTYIDALYVHPIETSIGLCLFLFAIPIVALLAGAPLSAFSTAIATLVFTQLNTLNHVYTRMPDRFPYNLVDYITGVHAAHHVDMNQGNYATLTMFYDKLFGTYEEPVHRSTA